MHLQATQLHAIITKPCARQPTRVNPESFFNMNQRVCWIAASCATLVSCGGSQPTASSNAMAPQASNAAAAAGYESGIPTKIVKIGGSAAAIALFPDGKVLYNPDGFNLAGGDSTIVAYGGPLQMLDVVSVGGGIDALFSDGTAYFSPDGKSLGGGGSTVPAYSGIAQIAALAPVAGGVDAIFANGADVYYSPDGRDLGGGGHSVRIYAGQSDISQIVAVGAGEAVVALMNSGAAYFSPDNRYLAGGGSTVAAGASIKALIKVGGGVLAESSNGSVYLSPDGRNLTGGGATIAVSAWSASSGDGPFGPRDSAHGAQFAGHLWLSGGYFSPTNTNSCFATCSYFDLWSSADPAGTSWNAVPNFATSSAPVPRDDTAGENLGVPDVAAPTDFYEAYSPIVVWSQRLFAIGMRVWSSADGSQWAQQVLADGVTPAKGPLPFRATENSRALVLGSNLFYVQPDTGEVYSTTDPDAAVWNTLGTIAGFAPRCGAVVFVLESKLWIEGGGACNYSAVYNDIWSSSDGVSWSQSTKLAEWPARMWACAALGSDGVVWLAGGYAPTDWNKVGATVTPRAGANHADVWYTKDGADWKQLKPDAGSGLPDGATFEPRHAATCFSVAGSSANTQSLVAIGGTGGTDANDADARTINSIRTLALPSAAVLP